ncbi:hypothetical protein ACET3Z_010108 [Daucus carota]
MLEDPVARLASFYIFFHPYNIKLFMKPVNDGFKGDSKKRRKEPMFELLPRVQLFCMKRVRRKSTRVAPLARMLFSGKELT